MSDGAFNLGSQHPVRIDATDDAPMTLINKGDTIYLGQQPNVSASTATQTVTNGQQTTLTIPTWAISASSSHILVSNPVAKLTQTLTTIINQTIDNTTIQQIIQQIDPAVLNGIQGQFDTANNRLQADENLISSNQAGLNSVIASFDDTLLPALDISKAGTQSITSGGNAQVINFDTEIKNTGPFSWAQGPPAVVTIPSTGWYSGVLGAQFAFNAAGMRILQVKKNDAAILQEAHANPSNDGATATKVNMPWGPFYLTGGDTMKFLAFQNSGSSMNIAANAELNMVKHKHVGQQAGGTGGSSGGTGTFTAIGSGALSAGTWYPTSIFKTPISSLSTTGQTVHSNSANIIASIFSRGPAATGGRKATIVGYSGLGGKVGIDFSHPVYVAVGGDPTVNLTTTNYVNSDLTGYTIKIPSNALWSKGSDGSMGVIQPDGQWQVDFWGIDAANTNIANGQITCGFARRVRIDQTGIGTQTPDRGGITAARFAHGLGIVRIDELTSSYGGGSLTTIDHALFVAVNGWNGRVYPGPLQGGTSGQIGDVNAPAMGAHLRVKASFDVAASGLPLWHKRIMKALQTYGAYIGDNGGSSLNFQLESENPYIAAGVAPTCLNYLDTVTSHTPGAIYDIDAGVSWASVLEVLNPPT